MHVIGIGGALIASPLFIIEAPIFIIILVALIGRFGLAFIVNAIIGKIIDKILEKREREYLESQQREKVESEE